MRFVMPTTQGGGIINSLVFVKHKNQARQGVPQHTGDGELGVHQGCV